VLKELPKQMEQTLYCEMNAKQSKLYNELRGHYRAHIGKEVGELGIKRSKIHVLEALLRLRQAACDPRLIDKRQNIEGAKIALLLEQLADVTAEGHKALVFSQFTSLLALVRAELDTRDWTYEYLDGKTRKRGEKVKRFQEDKACKLFLISL
jgi:SNF2 family DNA or RNA helicase